MPTPTQSFSSVTSGASTITASPTTANLSAGTKLIAYVVSDGTSLTISSVKDASLNTFSQVASVTSSQVNLAIFQLDTPSGDVGTKPVFTATVTGGTGFLALLIEEVPGLAPGTTNTQVVDGTPATLTGAGTNFTTGNPSYTSSEAGEYLVSVLGTSSSGTGDTPTVPTGYSADTANQTGATNGALLTLWNSYKSSTGGAEGGSYTDATTASTSWAVIEVAFNLGLPAISEDSSTPAVATSTSNTTGIITSASFSPPAGSLLVAIVGVTFASGAVVPNITLSDSSGLVWTPGPRIATASHDTFAGIWTARVGSAPGAITVTATDTIITSSDRMLTVRVVNNAAVNQLGAGQATNSGAPGVATTVDAAGSVITTKAGSWIYAVASGGSSGASTITNDSGTATLSGLPFQDPTVKGSITAGTHSPQAIVTPGSTAVGWNISGTFWWAWAGLEILPLSVATPTPLILEQQGGKNRFRRRKRHPQQIITAFAGVSTGNADVTPTTVDAASTIPNPGIRADANQTVSAVSATSSIPAPVVSAGSVVTPTAIAATVSIPVPAISTSANVLATAVSATASIPGPVVKTGSTVTPTAVAATSSIPAPVVTTALVIPAVAVSATSSIPVPVITTSALVTPTAVSATVSIPVPGVQIGTTVTPTSVAATVSLPIPLLLIGAKATPSAVSATSSIPVPSVLISSNVSANAVNATSSIPVPAISTSALVTPTAVAATVSIPIPAVSAGGSVNIVATAVSATVSIPSPVITAIRNALVTPVTLAVSASVPVPGIIIGTTVTPTAVSASASIPAPVVTASRSAIVVTSVINAVTSIPSPVVTVSVSIRPVSVSATTLINSPVIKTGALVTPSTILSTSFIPLPRVPEQILFGFSVVFTGTTSSAEESAKEADRAVVTNPNAASSESSGKQLYRSD